MKISELISRSAMLRKLDPSLIQYYLSDGRFRVRTYPENTILHLEGEPCTKMELILSGDIVVERLDENGGLLTIAEFVEDDILGGTLLFSRRNEYPMTVTVRKPSVILEIERGLLLELFQSHPDFLLIFLEYISDNALNLTNKLRHYVKRSIRDSLLSFLAHERRIRHSDRIALNMTKKALADKIGVQRTSLSRELAKMRRDGLIDFDAHSITLLKKADS